MRAFFNFLIFLLKFSQGTFYRDNLAVHLFKYVSCIMFMCIYVFIIIIIIIIISFITVFTGVLFVHQPGANHAPRASVTQVNHSVHTLSTFLRIRADPSMQIFWISVILALSDTFLMFSTIPFFTVPSAPTTTGIYYYYYYYYY